MTKKNEAEELEQLRRIDELLEEELLALTTEEIAELTRPGDADTSAMLLAQAAKEHGKQRLAAARTAVSSAQRQSRSLYGGRPPARPLAERPSLTLAARNARSGSSADQPGIDDDLAELEADREHDGDDP